MTPDPTAALAALSDSRAYTNKPDRPIVLKLEDSRTLQIPGPRLLAAVFARPWLAQRYDAARDGGSTLALSAIPGNSPTTLDRVALARDVRQAIADLPDDRTAERPYRDLCAFVDAATPGTVADYFRQVMAYVHRDLPRWHRPAAPRQARTESTRTPTEQKADYRARMLAAEVASARWWLEGYIDPENDEAPEHGARLGAPDLYALARDVIEEMADDGEAIDDAPDVLFRVPGPRTFYAVADMRLGARRRSHGVAYYTIPTPHPTKKESAVNLAEAVLARTVEILATETADEYRAAVAAEIRELRATGRPAASLLVQRGALSATATPSVDDLAARRARRTA